MVPGFLFALTEEKWCNNNTRQIKKRRKKPLCPGYIPTEMVVKLMKLVLGMDHYIFEGGLGNWYEFFSPLHEYFFGPLALHDFCLVIAPTPQISNAVHP